MTQSSAASKPSQKTNATQPIADREGALILHSGLPPCATQQARLNEHMQSAVSQTARATALLQQFVQPLQVTLAQQQLTSLLVS